MTGQTLWYAPLGMKDSHDFATRGYLDALMSVGFQGLRLPPSFATGLLDLNNPDLERFAPLALGTGLPPVVRIQPGDPRIGTPRPVGNADGVLSGADPLADEDKLYKAGDVDLAAQPVDAHVTAASDPVTRILIHHDPGSLVRNLSGMLRGGRPQATLIGLTVWEPDRIPAGLAQVLSELDMLLVPSEHTKQAILRSGFDSLIEVVPHAFDCARRWPRPTGNPAGSQFRFYTVAAPIERKNLVTLVAAYLETFRSDEEVVLQIKTSGNKAGVQKLMQDAAGLVGSQNHPKVLWYLGHWTDAAMCHFHQTSDCWVSATRGEGFGMGEVEAALSGNEVITTDWGAAPELLGEGHRLVPCDLVPVPTHMAKIGPYSESQRWADPARGALGAAMRAAFLARRGKRPEQWDALHPLVDTEPVGLRLASLLEEAATCDL